MLRIILISVMSLALTGAIYLRFDQQVGSDGIQSLNHAPTYAPYYAPFLLPLLFLLPHRVHALFGPNRGMGGNLVPVCRAISPR